MNSKLKILLACSILIISSCSTPSYSTSISDPQNTPSEFYNSLPQEKNENYLYQYLRYVGLHGNYTLTYDIEGTECYDLFNEDYYYMSILNNGGILLPYYDQSEIEGDVVYRYELDNNNINILLPENGISTEKYYVDSINEISYFSLLADETDTRYLISRDSFIYNKTDDKYYSNSVTLNSLLTIAVGYSSLVFNGLVSGVSFDFLNNGDISYTVYMTGLDENGEYKVFVHKLQIGEIILMGFGGELYSALGKEIQEKIGKKNLILINHDASLLYNSGYIYSDEVFELAEKYESNIVGMNHTWMKPGYILEALVKNMQEMF